MQSIPRHFRSMALRFGILISTLLAVSPVATASSPIVGVGVHVISSSELQPRILDLSANMGFGSVRSDVPWRFAETKKGTLEIPASWDAFVDGARSRGMQPLLILDYGNPLYDNGDKPHSAEAIAAFTRYAEFTVKHFAGRVHYFEIWNEWDGGAGGNPPGSIRDYATLFKATYPVVKRAAPDAVFLASSLIPHSFLSYYQELAESGVVDLADGVAMHPYNYSPALGPEQCATDVIENEKVLTKFSKRSQVDIYVTEMGWPSTSGHGDFNEQGIANFVPRTLLLLSSLPFVKGIWWYDLKDDGADPNNKENRFGLVRTDLSPKPAANTMRLTLAYLRNHDLAFLPESQLAHGQVAMRTTSRGGEASEMRWDANGTIPADLRRLQGR